MLFLQRVIEFISLIFAPNSGWSAGQTLAYKGFASIVLAAIAIGVFCLVIKIISKIKSLAFI